jgi:hypothetical protein
MTPQKNAIPDTSNPKLLCITEFLNEKTRVIAPDNKLVFDLAERADYTSA